MVVVAPGVVVALGAGICGLVVVVVVVGAGACCVVAVVVVVGAGACCVVFVAVVGGGPCGVVVVVGVVAPVGDALTDCALRAAVLPAIQPFSALDTASVLARTDSREGQPARKLWVRSPRCM